MAVRYGIICDRCKKLHFIAGESKSGRVRYDRDRGEFKATCVLPCVNIISFQRRMLSPYIVPEEAVQRGYADLDECRPLRKS